MDPEATRHGTEPSEVIAAVLATGGVPGVASAYLFGSYAEGRAHRESDVDVGVLLRFDRHPTAHARFEVRLRLQADLGTALGREVDVVILNDAPPLLARRIAVHGRRVFCTDAEADHAFVRDAQLRAADIEPFIRRARRTTLAALQR